jgi:hypothetical protein
MSDYQNVLALKVVRKPPKKTWCGNQPNYGSVKVTCRLWPGGDLEVCGQLGVEALHTLPEPAELVRTARAVVPSDQLPHFPDLC